jgi:Mg2+-importing ATPase
MMSVAADAVDEEHGERPQRWDVAEVRRFMLVFGLLSSLFDLLAFGLLLWVMAAGEAGFQTAWFLLSLWTEIAVVLVLRTARPAWRSRPARLLLVSSAAVGAAAVAVPYLGAASALFGFVPLSAAEMLAIIGLIAAYVVANEAAKRAFWRHAVRRAAPEAARRA